MLEELQNDDHTDVRYGESRGWTIETAKISVINAAAKAWTFYDTEDDYFHPQTMKKATDAMQIFFKRKDGSFLFKPLYGREQLYEVRLDSDNKPKKNDKGEFEKEYILLDVPKDKKEQTITDFVNEVHKGEWNEILTNMHIVKRSNMKTKNNSYDPSMSLEKAANKFVVDINKKITS